MTNPLISIIVPVYNAEKYLRSCLDSVMTQSYTNWECILIDDGSPDESGNICDQYSESDTRFIVIHKNNEGPAEARNQGLKSAKGDYITFVDSDDEMMPGTLMAYSEAVDKYGEVDVIKAGYIKFYEYSSNIRSFSCNQDCVVYNHSSAVQKLNDISMYHGFLWNECIRSELTKGVVFDKNVRWNEDNLFSYQCFMKAHSFVFLSHIAYKYFIRREESLSNIKDPVMMINTSSEVLRYRKEMAQPNAPSKFIKSMENKYIMMFHRAISLCIASSSNDIRNFISQVPQKDIISKDIVARMLLNGPFNLQVNILFYKILLNVRKIFNHLM